MSFTGRCFGGPLHGRTVASPADRLYAAIPRPPRQWINDFGRTPSPRQVAKVTYRRERVGVRDQTFECWVAEDYPSNLVLREVEAFDGAPLATDADRHPRSPMESHQ